MPRALVCLSTALADKIQERNARSPQGGATSRSFLSLTAFLSSTGERMALTAAQIDQQRKQAEELLFSGPQTLGFAKGLFFGHFNGNLLFPYPDLDRGQ